MRYHRAVLPLKAAAAAALLCTVNAWAQEPLRYLVRVEDPSSRLYQVEAQFPASGDTTYLSLPAWTPGHYKIENYARFVRDFRAYQGGRPLRWDKLDKDTWRIFSRGTSQVSVSFEFAADTVELSMSLLRDDFGFFNGTNLFMFPGARYDLPAEVRFQLPEGWEIATELEEGDEPGVYRAANYHELVDSPTFLGRFALDSVRVDGRWIRLAVYPAARLNAEARELALSSLAAISRSVHALFGEPPFQRYTVFIYLDEERFAFLAGLEHADSHLNIMPAIIFEQPRFSFRPYVYRLFAHEYYHAWNVKRIRPAELWPYDYEREQSTPLLWVSEGITDYYGHLVLVRAGLWGENEFWAAIREAIISSTSQPLHEAVEDASLNTWMAPTFVDQYLYYEKGALLGLLLDIRIRQATQSRNSLDDVMKRLYSERYERERGFTTDDFLEYVGEHLGRAEVEQFYAGYVDGRKPLPLQETLALAGMSYQADTIVEPFLGVQVGASRERRVVVREVIPGSAAARVGLRAGDELLRVGKLFVEDQEWGESFRRAYADSIGAQVPIVVRRNGREIELRGTVGSQTRYAHRLGPLATATEEALELKRRLLAGEPRAVPGRQ